MVHIGANTVYNEWTGDVFLAYSAASPTGGVDIWVVSRLSSGDFVDNVDVDYIRTADAGTSLQYVSVWTNRVIFTAVSPAWVKLRQFSTSSIARHPTDPKVARLVHFAPVGDPVPALDEAATYDTGWHVLGSKETRGTQATKDAIRQWEDIIKANQVGKIGSAHHNRPVPRPRYR